MDQGFGTSTHMTLHMTTFLKDELINPSNVDCDEISIIQAIGMGSNFVEIILEYIINQIRIKGVFHIPKFHANLLMVSKLVSNGLESNST